MATRQKTSASRPRSAPRLVLAGAMLGTLSVPALAGPEGEEVVHGHADFTRQDFLTLIRTHGPRTIINYRSFNLEAWETVRFLMPGQNSRVLNRITGGMPTNIDGSVYGNGNVYFVNNAGIVFGQNAVINVGGFFAAAGNLSNRDFLNGRNHFTNLNGSVINNGEINAGQVHLAGAHVANFGTVSAPQGVVTFSAGDDVLIGSQRGRVFARINSDRANDLAGAGVENAGLVDASGGQVLMGAGDHFALALHDTSEIVARRVRIEGDDVQVAGVIDTSNQVRGNRGGSIELLGSRVKVDEALIDASGMLGGGRIRIGGDFQGRGNLERSEATWITEGTVIDASATDRGDGGSVIVWSDKLTLFRGTINARGGDIRGDGGFVEVSGKQTLQFTGDVDTSATLGVTGTLLLDPTDVRIVDAAADATLDDVDMFDDPNAAGDESMILASDIVSQLDLTDVIILAQRDILFDVGLTSAATNDLVLTAGRGITLADNVVIDLGGSFLATINSNDAGIDLAFRGSDAASFVMGTGSSITADENVTITMGSGIEIAPDTFAPAGTFDLQAITGDTVRFEHDALTFNAAITATTELQLAGGNFVFSATDTDLSQVVAPSIAVEGDSVSFTGNQNVAASITIDAGDGGVSIDSAIVSTSGNDFTIASNTGDVTFGNDAELDAGTGSVDLIGAGFDLTGTNADINAASIAIRTTGDADLQITAVEAGVLDGATTYTFETQSDAASIIFDDAVSFFAGALDGVTIDAGAGIALNGAGVLDFNSNATLTAGGDIEFGSDITGIDGGEISLAGVTINALTTGVFTLDGTSVALAGDLVGNAAGGFDFITGIDATGLTALNAGTQGVRIREGFQAGTTSLITTGALTLDATSAITGTSLDAEFDSLARTAGSTIELDALALRSAEFTVDSDFVTGLTIDDLRLFADGNITFMGVVTTDGSIIADAGDQIRLDGATVTSNNGDLDLAAVNGIDAFGGAVALNAESGLVALRGAVTANDAFSANALGGNVLITDNITIDNGSLTLGSVTLDAAGGTIQITLENTDGPEDFITINGTLDATARESLSLEGNGRDFTVTGAVGSADDGAIGDIFITNIANTEFASTIAARSLTQQAGDSVILGGDVVLDGDNSALALGSVNALDIQADELTLPGLIDALTEDGLAGGGVFLRQTAGGNLATTGGLTIEALGDVDITGITTGAIDIGGAFSITSGGSISLQAANGILADGSATFTADESVNLISNIVVARDGGASTLSITADADNSADGDEVRVNFVTADGVTITNGGGNDGNITVVARGEFRDNGAGETTTGVSINAGDAGQIDLITNADFVLTAGDVSLRGAINLARDLLITTDGNIDLLGDITGNGDVFSVTLDAGTGMIMLGGNVGGDIAGANSISMLDVMSSGGFDSMGTLNLGALSVMSDGMIALQGDAAIRGLGGGGGGFRGGMPVMLSGSGLNIGNLAVGNGIGGNVMLQAGDALNFGGQLDLGTSNAVVSAGTVTFADASQIIGDADVSFSGNFLNVAEGAALVDVNGTIRIFGAAGAHDLAIGDDGILTGLADAADLFKIGNGFLSRLQGRDIIIGDANTGNMDVHALQITNVNAMDIGESLRLNANNSINFLSGSTDVLGLDAVATNLITFAMDEGAALSTTRGGLRLQSGLGGITGTGDVELSSVDDIELTQAFIGDGALTVTFDSDGSTAGLDDEATASFQRIEAGSVSITSGGAADGNQDAAQFAGLLETTNGGIAVDVGALGSITLNSGLFADSDDLVVDQVVLTGLTSTDGDLLSDGLAMVFNQTLTFTTGGLALDTTNGGANADGNTITLNGEVNSIFGDLTVDAGMASITGAGDIVFNLRNFKTEDLSTLTLNSDVNAAGGIVIDADLRLGGDLVAQNGDIFLLDNVTLLDTVEIDAGTQTIFADLDIDMGANDLTLTADAMTFGLDSIITGSGNLRVRPSGEGVTIAVGDGVDGLGTLVLGTDFFQSVLGDAGFTGIVNVGYTDGSGVISIGDVTLAASTIFESANGGIDLVGDITALTDSSLGLTGPITLLGTTGLDGISNTIAMDTADLMVNGTVDGDGVEGRGLRVTSNAGEVTLAGTVGGNNELFALDIVNAGGIINFNALAVNAQEQSYDAATFNINNMGAGVETLFASSLGSINFLNGQIALAGNDLRLVANEGTVSIASLSQDADRSLSINATTAEFTGDVMVTNTDVVADNVTIDDALASFTGDTIAFRQRSDGRDIELGGIDGGASLHLSEAELSTLMDGFTSITIGNENTGVLAVNDLGLFRFRDPLSLVAGNEIRVNAQLQGESSIAFMANLTTLAGDVVTGTNLQGDETADLLFDGAVALEGSRTLSTNGGTATFMNTVDAVLAGGSLLIDGASGSAFFMDVIGGTTALDSVTIFVTENVEFAGIGSDGSAGVTGLIDVEVGGTISYAAGLYETGEAAYDASSGHLVNGDADFVTFGENISFSGSRMTLADGVDVSINTGPGNVGDVFLVGVDGSSEDETLDVNTGRGSLTVLESLGTTDSALRRIRLDGFNLALNGAVTTRNQDFEVRDAGGLEGTISLMGDYLSLDAGEISLTGNTVLDGDTMLMSDGGRVVLTGGTVTGGSVFTVDTGADGEIVFGGSAVMTDADQSFTAGTYTITGVDGTFTFESAAGNITFNEGLMTLAEGLGLDITTLVGNATLARIEGSGAETVTLRIADTLTMAGVGTDVGTGVEVLDIRTNSIAVTGDVFADRALLSPTDDARDVLVAAGDDAGSLSLTADILDRFRGVSTSLSIGRDDLSSMITVGMTGVETTFDQAVIFLTNFSDRIGGGSIIVDGDITLTGEGDQLSIGSVLARISGDLTTNAGDLAIFGSQFGAMDFALRAELLGTTINTNGGMFNISGEAFIDDAVAINTDGGDIQVFGSIDGVAMGSGDLTLNTGAGSIFFSNGIGQTMAIGSLDVTADEVGFVATSVGDQTVNGATTLAGATLESTAGSILFDDTIQAQGVNSLTAAMGVDLSNGVSGGNGELTIAATDGAAIIDLGEVDGISSLAIDNAGTTMIAGNITTADLVRIDGSSVLMNMAQSIESTRIELLGDIDSADGVFTDLSLVASDRVELRGNLGTNRRLMSLTTGGAGSTLLASDIQTISMVRIGHDAFVDGMASIDVQGKTEARLGTTDSMDGIVFGGRIDAETGSLLSELRLSVSNTLGDLITGANGLQTPDPATPIINFQGSIGELTFVGINEDGRDFVPANATVVFGNIEEFAAGVTGNFEILADRFVVGAREKIVSLGSLRWNGSSATIGDLVVAGTLNIFLSEGLTVLARQADQVFDPTTGRVLDDFGTDIVADGTININRIANVVSVDGSRSLILVGSSGEVNVGSAPVGGVQSRSLNGDVDSLIRWTPTPGAATVIVDARATGSGNSDIATALAGALTLDLPDLPEGTSVSAVLRDELRALGINTKLGLEEEGIEGEALDEVVRTMVERVRRVAAYQDLSAPLAEGAGVSAERLELDVILGVLDYARSIFYEPVLDADGMPMVDEEGNPRQSDRRGDLRSSLESALSAYYDANPDIEELDVSGFERFIAGSDQADVTAAASTISELRNLYNRVGLFGLSAQEMDDFLKALYGNVAPNDWIFENEFSDLIRKSPGSVVLREDASEETAVN